MPNLNHTGPEGKGPKTGRKLGTCMKKENEETGLIGLGEGLRRNSGGGRGRGKRFKYEQKNKSKT